MHVDKVLHLMRWAWCSVAEIYMSTNDVVVSDMAESNFATVHGVFVGAVSPVKSSCLASLFSVVFLSLLNLYSSLLRLNYLSPPNLYEHRCNLLPFMYCVMDHFTSKYGNAVIYAVNFTVSWTII